MAWKGGEPEFGDEWLVPEVLPEEGEHDELKGTRGPMKSVSDCLGTDGKERRSKSVALRSSTLDKEKADVSLNGRSLSVAVELETTVDGCATPSLDAVLAAVGPRDSADRVSLGRNIRAFAALALEQGAEDIDAFSSSRCSFLLKPESRIRWVQYTIFNTTRGIEHTKSPLRNTILLFPRRC